MQASHAPYHYRDIDPDAPGTQHGLIEIPQVDALVQAALQWPLSTFAGNADGAPHVLFISVGDGSCASVLRRLTMLLTQDSALQGRVTLLSLPAASDGQACPVLSTLVDAADIVVTVRDAGERLRHAPSACIRLQRDRDRQREAEALMFAFGAACSVRRLPLPGSDPLAELVEAAETLHVDVVPGNTAPGPAHAVHEAVVGCCNLLVQAGVLQRELELRAGRILQLESPDGSVFARRQGALDLLRDPGQNVHRGSVLARLYPHGGTPADTIEILTPRDGVLLAATALPNVAPGDCIAVIADEMPC